MQKHTAVIGVGVEATTAFGRQILRGVTRYANIHRKWLLLKEFNVYTTDPARWPTCDGAVVAMTEPHQFEVLKSRCNHIVSCSGGADPSLVPVVSMDDEAVGRLAAEHLLERRLKRFGYYGYDLTLGIAKRRVGAFCATLLAKGYPVDICRTWFKWDRQLTYTTQKHWAGLIDWLQGLPKPIGILGIDDMAAADLASACLAADLHVPDQIAIVGVNNDDLLCESAWPPLSSVQCDYQRVGYSAAELLDKLIKGETVTEQMRCTRLPPVGVVCRQSSNLVSVDNEDLAHALKFIREHACDPCSVSDVLREVPVSRRWLERSCLEQIGCTPYDVIIRERMKRAEELLIKTDLGLGNIAQTCGFGDTRNFRFQFQKVYHEAPNAFRRSRKSK